MELAERRNDNRAAAIESEETISHIHAALSKTKRAMAKYKYNDELDEQDGALKEVHAGLKEIQGLAEKEGKLAEVRQTRKAVEEEWDESVKRYLAEIAARPGQGFALRS